MSIEQIYRQESPRALATLIRLLGDFDLAEEMLQEAFAIAVERWPEDGMPANPGSWLISTARHKAIDRIRRNRNFADKQPLIAAEMSPVVAPPDPERLDEQASERAMPDDRLRLIFTCCHPALALDARVALTLRTLCGLTTEEIARAFLVPVPTMAQRLVRAKRKIRDAGIPYEVPPPDRIEERLAGVSRVVYLVFNEGYLATMGDGVVRHDLCREAIRLGRLICGFLPDEVEAQGLLALMLLHDSRRDARTDSEGRLVVLEEQDRERWDREQIAEGLELVNRAMSSGSVGVYTLQAAIAARHASAPRPEDTQWSAVASLYQALLAIEPSPVVELNLAVAIAMAQGPAAGLERLDDLAAQGKLDGYHLLPAARGDMLRRLDRREEAAAAYTQALELTANAAERRFLRRRLDEVTAP